MTLAPLGDLGKTELLAGMVLVVLVVLVMLGGGWLRALWASWIMVDMPVHSSAGSVVEWVSG